MKRVSIKTAIIGMVVLGSCFALMARAQSVAEIQRAIEEKGANWIAGDTPSMHLPPQSLCGTFVDPQSLASGEPWAPERSKSSLNVGTSGSFDWRTYGGHNWVTGVRDQNPCGSCYIFGPCAAAEAAMRVQAPGSLGYLANPDFSEQFILSCNGWSCGGGNPADTANFLRDSGAPNEGCFPYTASDATPCSNRCSDWANKIHRINAWGWVGGVANPTVDQIKTAIETYGPVASFMTVYTDFFSYRGGVYSHVNPHVEGGHDVLLVGWNDVQGCWYAKNSWGTDWGETADMNPTSPGAINGGWFRIQYGDSDIGTYVQWVQAGMANLTGYPRAGWTYPLVPRNTNDASDGACALPATLNGDAATTYWNFSAINNGGQDAPPNEFDLYVDDNWHYWGAWGVWGAGVPATWKNFGPDTITGGRHTVGMVMDVHDDVWETDETDNTYYRQFVWSPTVLDSNTPWGRSAPPRRDSTGAIYENCDGFAFTPTPSGWNDYWAAVGVLPASGSADYDVALYNTGSYTGSETGFDDTYVTRSSYGAGTLDFVLVNRNVASAGTYYAGVVNYSNDSADYRIENDTSETIYPRPGTRWSDLFSRTDDNVLDVYEAYLTTGTKAFLLHQIMGTCNLGMTLYGPSAGWYRKSGYIGYANSGGDGADETFRVNILTAGYYALVVWKNSAADYSKTASYQIAFGAPAVTVTAPNGGETVIVGEPATITWDTLGDPGSTVRIEISRDGGSSWSSLVASTPDNGTYTWTPDYPTSNQCRIKIFFAADPTVYDVSEGDFTIGARTITVTTPNGGETWILGESNTISWTSQNVPDNLNIDISRDDGLTWSNLFVGLPNTGSCVWTVTGPATAQNRIRITSAWYSNATDCSDSVFTIGSRSIHLTSPVAGDYWYTGQSKEIRWTSQYVGGNLKIELSRDGGSTWFPIIPGTPDDGSQFWTVTEPTTSMARIRILSMSYPAVSDTGPYFNIVQHRISGTVTLQDWSVFPSVVPVTFEVRPVGTVAPAETHVVNPADTGDYSFYVSVCGSYDIAAKAGHWLRQIQPGIIVNTNASASFNLTNGDADADNAITSTDLSIVLANLDTTSAAADLNGSGTVTVADLAIVIANMDQMGSP